MQSATETETEYDYSLDRTKSTDGSEKKDWLSEILQKQGLTYSSSSSRVSVEPNFKELVMQISSDLYNKYPLIAIDEEILGEPRLAGTRFAVSNVLTALTLYNSFDEVIEEYEGRYTEKQLKEAVKFARDFLDSFYRS